MAKAPYSGYATGMRQIHSFIMDGRGYNDDAQPAWIRATSNSALSWAVMPHLLGGELTRFFPRFDDYEAGCGYPADELLRFDSFKQLHGYEQEAWRDGDLADPTHAHIDVSAVEPSLNMNSAWGIDGPRASTYVPPAPSRATNIIQNVSVGRSDVDTATHRVLLSKIRRQNNRLGRYGATFTTTFNQSLDNLVCDHVAETEPIESGFQEADRLVLSQIEELNIGLSRWASTRSVWYENLGQWVDVVTQRKIQADKMRIALHQQTIEDRSRDVSMYYDNQLKERNSDLLDRKAAWAALKKSGMSGVAAHARYYDLLFDLTSDVAQITGSGGSFHYKNGPSKGQQIFSGVASGALAGLSTGSALGPVGALAGLGIGAVFGLLGNIG